MHAWYLLHCARLSVGFNLVVEGPLESRLCLGCVLPQRRMFFPQLNTRDVDNQTRFTDTQRDTRAHIHTYTHTHTMAADDMLVTCTSTRENPSTSLLSIANLTLHKQHQASPPCPNAHTNPFMPLLKHFVLGVERGCLRDELAHVRFVSTANLSHSLRLQKQTHFFCL